MAEQVNAIPANGITPGMSLATIKLIDLLKSGATTLTDAQLTEACGKDTRPGGNGYGSLSSAIRHCRKNHNVVWERVRMGGAIKRLDSIEAVQSVDRDRKHVNRKSKVAIQKLHVAAMSAGDDATKTDINRRAAQMGAIAALASTSALKRMECSGNGLAEKPDMHKLLEAMKK